MINYSRIPLVMHPIRKDERMFSRFRGRIAKNSYRYVKTAIITKSFTMPAFGSAIELLKEMISGELKQVNDDTGNYILTYISSLLLSGCAYKGLKVKRLKNTARVIYNIISFPMMIYFKGYDHAFKLLQLAEFEKRWFGEEVPILPTGKLFFENNFTTSNAIENILGGDE